MRVVIAGGLVLVLALLLVKTFVLKRSVPASIAVPQPVHHQVQKTPAHQGRHAVVTHVRIDASLPAPLRRALAHHAVVVAVLYAPHAPGDEDAVQAARQGARGAHAGFTVLNVSNEAIAQAVALKAPGSADPSVLVVRRPGTITVLLNGYADSEAVAAAAKNAG
jgi:hypothetical protein